MTSHGEKRDSWEQMGAASGLFVTLLFVTAFIIFLMTDPGGGNTPALPDLTSTGAAPAYIADNLQAVRAQVMLNAIGLAFFLWFLGTLWSTLRRSEGAPGRGSTIAVTGAVSGVVLTLVGLVLAGTATLTTSAEQAAVVPTLYTAAALFYAFGGALFTIFYLGVAEVSFRSGALPRWLAYLALLAALVSVFGFVTPYATSGAFNAATGAIGFYGHHAAFVVWVFLASATLTMAQHRRGKPPTSPGSEPDTDPSDAAAPGAQS